MARRPLLNWPVGLCIRDRRARFTTSPTLPACVRVWLPACLYVRVGRQDGCMVWYDYRLVYVRVDTHDGCMLSAIALRYQHL